MAPKEKNTHLIKQEAIRLGFLDCGIAKAVKLEDDARRLELWLKNGYHAGMTYMEHHFDLRIDPALLVPGAKSVITLLVNYFPAIVPEKGKPKIAKYAYGIDYHYVIRNKLNELLQYIKCNIGDVTGRGFVDSAPVLERSWAVRSGLGWLGKNSNLINLKTGSFFFIATLITDLDLVPDLPFATDHCGTCTRCIDACPTEAINPAGNIDSNKCISYLTIELKDAVIPGEFREKMDNWLFGCDICQDVCPWNRFSKPHQEAAFSPIPELLQMDLKDWEDITEERFNSVFKNSPLKRSKWKGIQRNLKILS